MTDFAYGRNRSCLITKSCYLLCGMWFLGLVFGCYFSVLLEPYFLSLMHSYLIQPVSIVGLCACIFFPLLLTYFSLFTDRTVLILAVCFSKALAFAFSASLIIRYFGEAGWLMQCLVLFSDTCYSLVLMALWLYCLQALALAKYKSLCVCSILALLIAATDYYIISPYIMEL